MPAYSSRKIIRPLQARSVDDATHLDRLLSGECAKRPSRLLDEFLHRITVVSFTRDRHAILCRLKDRVAEAGRKNWDAIRAVPAAVECHTVRRMIAVGSRYL